MGEPPPRRRHRATTAAVVGGALVLPVLSIVLLAHVLLVGPATPAVPTPSAERPWAVYAREADGWPVRWDPCTPIRWAFAPAGAPTGGRALVEEAVDRLAAATGIAFVDVGDVDERPREDRPVVDDGTAWAPVLVGWIPVDADGPDGLGLRLQDRAQARTIAVDGPDGRVYVTGQVGLNTAWPLEVGFGDRHVAWGATVLHELAHVLGLDHVDAPGELMHRDPGFGPAVLGPGDLAGLAAVGESGGCLAVPPPREVEVVPPATISELGQAHHGR